MPVPNTIDDLNTTESLNSPQGTETAKGVIDNYFRRHASFIAQLRDGGAKFTQAGAGSVSGTMQDRGRLSVNLWDYLSSAQRADVLAGTGALDCTAALQAAHDYGATLASISGGYARGGVVVELPYGAIKFTTITRRNGVSMRGHGRYKSLLLMAQNGGTGFKSAAAASQLAADNLYWLEDSDYALIPHPSVTFSTATTLWNMIGFSRCTFRNIAIAVKANVTGVSVLGATTAGTGGPAQWYNDFYSFFIEAESSGGVCWDLGDSNAAKEQITTWNWYGGRTAGNGAAGVGMRLNAATGCNLFGHVFEGLANELIIGSAAGSRGCSQINLLGCYFEGSGTGYTIYPNALTTGLLFCFATGVTNTDNGTRTLIVGDGVTTMPVANTADSFRLVMANATQKPQVTGSAQPGFRFKNDAGNWVEIMNNANTSSASSFVQISDNIGRDLLKIGAASAQMHPSQFSIGNQSAASMFVGAGSPEGAVAASPGSTYQRTNGGAGTSFYVKESGTGNVGWVGK